jgi:hypothetical protein
MNTRNIRASLDRLEDSIINSEYYKEYTDSVSKDIFKKRKFENSQRTTISQIKFLEENTWNIMKIGENSKEVRQNILSIIDYIKKLRHYYDKNDTKNVLLVIQKIRALIPAQQEQTKFKIPNNIPSEIFDEVMADINELLKCYESACYRSTVILCGRIMETCLQRKYFDSTGNDILEKSPGIGLGKLIAKMMENKVPLDPGLTQQIHLVNQVRIFSVHKKQTVFYPSQAQAQAMILYTLDTIEKLF